MSQVQLILNDPVNYEVLKGLYNDPIDLEKAWPGAKHPLCPIEWATWAQGNQKSSSLLFQIHDAVVGHIYLKVGQDGRLFLCFVVLKAAYRGQGIIAKMLVLTDEFIGKNFPHLEAYLHVDPENLPALMAYKKHGFTAIEVTPQGRLRMRKKLNA